MKLQHTLLACTRLLLCAAWALGAFAAHAQVQSVAPDTFSMNVTTGGTAAGSVQPSISILGSMMVANGTGDRVATAALCTGAAVGVSFTPSCTGAATFGSVSVGAAANIGASQPFSVSFSAAQLAGFVPTLAAAGQPFGSRHFFVQITYNGSALPPSSAQRFVTLRINLIEPLPVGITAATVSLVDVSPQSPTPVNIRYTLAGADAAGAGSFCSALIGPYPASGVANANPCAPGSALGNANPAMGFASTGTQTGELLVVPESIARQAAARALASGNGIFYFVRAFNAGRFAVVQLRLNAGSASTPLSFQEVRLGFRDGGGLQNIGFFKRGQVMPPVAAMLRYQGAGVLRARWELVQPNDPAPSALDLRAEADLTVQERVQQRRYRVLDRVNIYLPPNGQAVISGPNPRLLANELYGQYLLVLRIEASDSVSGGLASAGQAGFVLPVLRYFVGETNGPNTARAGAKEPLTLDLLSPLAAALLPAQGAAAFSWEPEPGVGLYRLEIEANGKVAFAARVRPAATPGAISYTAPPFLQSQLSGKATRWRVVAMAADGSFLGASDWREIGQ